MNSADVRTLQLQILHRFDFYYKRFDYRLYQYQDNDASAQST